MGESCFGGDAATCVMGCEPNQYAVLTVDPYADDGPPVGRDAALVSPNLPPGCTSALGPFDDLLRRMESTELPPTVLCCPCE
jgi:hypothetical protein